MVLKFCTKKGKKKEKPLINHSPSLKNVGTYKTKKLIQVEQFSETKEKLKEIIIIFLQGRAVGLSLPSSYLATKKTFRPL